VTKTAVLVVRFLGTRGLKFTDPNSENSQERATENDIIRMYSSVFSWRRNDMRESSSLRTGAGSAFHVDGPATAKLRGP